MPLNRRSLISQTVNPFANIADSTQMAIEPLNIDNISQNNKIQADLTTKTEQTEDYHTFTTCKFEFTQHIFGVLYKNVGYTCSLNEAIKKLEQLNEPLKSNFGKYPPDCIIQTFEDQCILCHIAVLKPASPYLAARIAQWHEKTFDYPIINLSDYDYMQTRACVKFFYTHKLELEHRDFSQDLQKLVTLFNNEILKLRYNMLKISYSKYKLYQLGVKDAYSKPQFRVQHRANSRIGGLEADDIDSMLSSKIHPNRTENDCEGSTYQNESYFCSVMSKMKTTNSLFNPILNCDSKFNDIRSNEKPKTVKNPFGAE